MAKLIVIGAGPMGLAAADYAARSGLRVEAIDGLGGRPFIRPNGRAAIGD